MWLVSLQMLRQELLLSPHCFFNPGRNSLLAARVCQLPDLPPALQAVSMVIMLAYLSYLVAEHFGCSGIVAIFSCAVVMSHYAMYNIPRATRRATRHTAEVFSYLCEGAIFLYVGLDTIDPVTWEVGVLYWLLVVCAQPLA